MSFTDKFISIFAFMVRRKKIPNVFFPTSLSEKILSIKLNDESKLAPLRCLVSDRIKVRDYVSSKNTECKLIKLLWSGNNFSTTVWDCLPEKFVLKANHGSKMVKIVEKSKDSFNEILDLTVSWLNTDYYRKGREWVYKDLDKLLLVEEFIEFDGDVPPDYKLFCLNGKVAFVQVDLNRFNGHRRNIYSADFKLLDVEYQFPRGYDIEKPKLYDTAVKVAEGLSSDFDFIRVDLYVLDNDIYFGELTNFPGNCLESFRPESFDLEMGSLLKVDS
ncbi:hypothetical protein KW418_18965 [Vibrio fluvialis]|nr:hypothetical protein [Vibrio fluvialis]